MTIITMPPKWCSAICVNNLTDICIEQCSIKRDTSGLMLKPGLTISDMPKLPDVKNLNRDERFMVVVIYLEKITERLQTIPPGTE